MAKATGDWRRVVLGAGAARAAEIARPAESPAPADDFARIEQGVEMSGRLATQRPLRVEGEFRGEIQSASLVLVTESGSVEAPIRARSVEIHGAVVGDVIATREVVLHATGRLHGDVEAPSLVVERGAFFNGRTRMYRPEHGTAQAEAGRAPEAEATTAEPQAPTTRESRPAPADGA